MMRISSLTRAEKSLVAIAHALAVDCDYLVLDEPSASLPDSDVKRLFDVLHQLRDDGVGMIYVPHRLDEVFRIADRVVVLRDGEMVGVRLMPHTTPEELVDMIVGKNPKTFLRVELESRPPVMQLNNVNSESAGAVSFSILQGEILGFVGLRGVGQENIGRCLFGSQAYEGVSRPLAKPTARTHQKRQWP
ncbi:MAG: ribose transport system ATP-binding protein [Pseudomonadales bacterium]|jgi:ribose transport system ATP-binding protein